MTSSRVWFITGTSSGFGRALAEAALERGDQVAATTRSTDRIADLDGAHAIELDVTDSGQAKEAIDSAVAAFGRIDVLVNNAGYGLFGALEELPEDELRRQFETNVFGVLNVTRAALPVMRRQRSGHIVQMSSLAGAASIFSGESAYAATKFAVEGASEALANEIEHLGIRVTIVEPGPFRTDFAGGATAQPVTIDDYGESVGATLEWFAGVAGEQPGDPARAAQAIIAAVEADEPPLRLPLGEEALGAIRNKLDAQRRDLDAWDRVSAGTAFAAA